jgi:hypothetical protein
MTDPNYILGPGPDTDDLRRRLALFTIPIAAWEFSLGVYLTVTGFKPPNHR